MNKKIFSLFLVVGICSGLEGMAQRYPDYPPHPTPHPHPTPYPHPYPAPYATFCFSNGDSCFNSCRPYANTLNDPSADCGTCQKQYLDVHNYCYDNTKAKCAKDTASCQQACNNDLNKHDCRTCSRASSVAGDLGGQFCYY